MNKNERGIASKLQGKAHAIIIPWVSRNGKGYFKVRDADNNTLKVLTKAVVRKMEMDGYIQGNEFLIPKLQQDHAAYLERRAKATAKKGKVAGDEDGKKVTRPPKASKCSLGI